MKSTTNETLKRTTIARLVAGAMLAAFIALGGALAPQDAYAATSQKAAEANADGSGKVQEDAKTASSFLLTVKAADATTQIQPAAQIEAAKAEASNKLFDYDPESLALIGTQESTGHSICCPSFSCAYADAVLDGTVHGHEYYTCSCCTWTDWGGGESSYRCVGTDEELLREAYDQIASGRPTVIHVAAGFGEHWIALIGYQNVTDPDNLTLDNFIALDPWDGAQIVASDRYSLYGDGCEHISDR